MAQCDIRLLFAEKRDAASQQHGNMRHDHVGDQFRPQEGLDDFPAIDIDPAHALCRQILHHHFGRLGNDGDFAGKRARNIFQGTAHDDDGFVVEPCFECQRLLEAAAPHHDAVDGIYEGGIAVILAGFGIREEPIDIPIAARDIAIKTGGDEDMSGDGGLAGQVLGP